MRRRLAIASAGALALPAALAQPRGVRPDQRLRCGADLALAASGFARGVLAAFGRDTGIAVQLLPGTATAVLAAARDGELDGALCNAPAEEAALEQQGLLHSRHRLATGAFLLVGPAREALQARTAAGWLAELAAGRASAAVPFLTAADGSGTHLAEQRLWRAAGVEPRAPWYRTAAPGLSLVEQLRAGGAWALVERGAWQASGGSSGRTGVAPLADPLLEVPVHAMRSFRSPHPAGRLWSTWLGGRRGRAVAAARPGYRRAV